MCSTVLPCPLCCQPNFPTVDSLRISLVSVTSRPLVCPICFQMQMGLDKLTIHLFSHSLPCESINQFSSSQFGFHQLSSDGGDAVGLNVYVEDHVENIRGNGTDMNIAKFGNRRTKPSKSSDVNEIKNNIHIPTEIVSMQQHSQQSHPQKLQQQQQLKVKQQQQPLHYEQPVKIEVFESGNDDRMNHLSPSSSISAKDPAEPICIICGFTFRNQELHQMHMQLVHEIHVNDDTDENYTYRVGVTDENQQQRLVEDAHGPRNDSVASDGQAAKSRFQCHLCPKNFKMKGSLRVHLRVMHTVVGGMVAPKPVESELLNSSKQPPDDNCSSTTTTTSLVIQSHHLHRSAADNRAVAQVENDVLAAMMASPMPSPTTSVHSGGCSAGGGGGGGGGGGATTTVTSNGSETKLWECDICAKSFTTKYFLKKHKRLHTGNNGMC